MKKGVYKGQAAIEYMMIISMSLMILVPLLFVVNSYISESRDEMKIRALEDGVDSIGEASEMVYFQGYPSKMRIDLYVPENVQTAEVNENIIKVRLWTNSGEIDIVTTTQANLTGSLPTNAGTHSIEIRAQEDGLVNVSH